MAKYIILVILTVFFIALQFGFFSGLVIFGGTINLVILILVSSFFLEVEKEGLIISLILAFFYDFYLYSYFGLSIIAILVLYYLLVFLKNKIVSESNYLLILASVGFASIIFDLIVIGGLYFMYHLDFVYYLLYTILPDALINLIVALPLFLILAKLVSVLKLYRVIAIKERKISVGLSL